MNIKSFLTLGLATVSLLSILSTQAKAEQWIPSQGGNYPNNAVPSGTDSDGTTLYVCRIVLNSGYTPGKLNTKGGVCYVSYGGKEYSNSQYQVLVADNANWTQFQGNFNGAIQGGVDSDGGTLYICRNGSTIGKLTLDGICHYSYGGREYNISNNIFILTGY